MENPKNQIAERIKESNNVLVTVSANPSVDQLAAAIGLTLILNKLGKHGTAVFSGKVPSTIEFLKPEETIEKNTDSLRDFIIALDKSKADKLRYKVEDKMVKIFITPYRTSIDQEDLEFSQGDFNVDVVVALGVHNREDLDQAITSNGRILHDATVVSITTAEASSLGTVNWSDNAASSLSEMVVAMGDMLKTDLMDGQIATALLTGIVAETDRFSNAKTTSNTMNASAKLMAAGANQQLIATKLQEPEQPGSADGQSSGDKPKPGDDQGSDDGSLQIDHEELPEPQVEEIQIDEHGNMQSPKTEAIAPKSEQPQIEHENRPMLVETATPAVNNEDSGLPGYEEAPSEPKDNHIVTQPPALGGQLTANSEPEKLEPASDLLGSQNLNGTILSHDAPMANEEKPTVAIPEQPSEPQDFLAPSHQPDDQTLTEIEESVDSPHVDGLPDTTMPVEPSQAEVPPDVDQARDAVQSVVGQTGDIAPLEPIQALNAQPVNLDLGHDDMTAAAPAAPIAFPPTPSQDINIDPISGDIQFPGQPPLPAAPSFNTPPPMPPIPAPVDSNGLPTNLVPPMPGLPPDPTATTSSDPSAPPPVPPPMMPTPMPPIPPSFDNNTGTIPNTPV